jgi:hypothetical protein
MFSCGFEIGDLGCSVCFFSLLEIGSFFLSLLLPAGVTFIELGYVQNIVAWRGT